MSKNSIKSEKIDFVVTWVDNSDVNWQKEREKWAAKAKTANDPIFKKWTNNEIRYRDWEVFKYWFRAVEKYAPWVNKVYLITYGHIPAWLNTECKKLVIVKHEEFIPRNSLPTFNSNAIELNMHRIKGLAEKFVYFNDDMFLMSFTKPEDFFKNDLPRQTAGLDCVNLDLYITHAEINNIRVINEHFSKKTVIKRGVKKWFSLRNGKAVFKTILLLPWSRFTGMQENHVCIPYLKKSFEEVWKCEPSILKKTTASRFRQEDNVNHWLMENWQIAKGCFYPISQKRFLHLEEILTEKNLKKAFSGKYMCVCINDIACTKDEFEKQKKILHEAFEKRLSMKSIYER